ncbi:MAG TPA: BatD family protein, partial [Candidatus Baltobacteraceae bacterium]|nr:BatD family protein [Candidatus Baltobacteraceae bacterium]
QICLRDDVQNYGQPQFTSTPADGLTIGKSAGGGQFRTQIGSRVYTVIPISLVLTATKTGNLSLGPFTASMVVVLPSQNDAQVDPFMAQFFNQGEQKQVTLATDQINIQSLPLPDQNKPADFNGAVGDYQMTVTAGPTNVAVGDPITVRVQIAGRGALDSLTLPAQSGWNDFKLFPPTSKMDFSDQLETEGTKTFEEIVTPQSVDVRALPPISFSFFNPDDGNYHTLTQPAMQLAVHSAGSTPLPVIAANNNSAPQNQTPQDILPIEENPGTLAQASAPMVASPVFLAVQSLPVLAFLAALVWRKRTDNLANNPRLRRQRAVAALIASGMDDLKKYAAENKPDEFFATLVRLLQEQLGERLDCPASSITEAAIDDLASRRAPEGLLGELRELFHLCNQARYAPVRGTSELNSVAAQFGKTVAELQEVNA